MKFRFWPLFGVLILILGGLIALRLSSFKVSEQNVIASLQQHLTPASLLFFQVVSKYISIISLGIPGLFLIAGLIKKDRGMANKGLYILLSITLAGIFGFCLKRTIKEPRPYEVDQRITQYSSGGSNSFPSGHTAEATVATIGFCFILFRGWLPALFSISWAALMMFTRIILGVHNFTDIAGGIVVGLLGLLVMLEVFDRLNLSSSLQNSKLRT